MLKALNELNAVLTDNDNLLIYTRATLPASRPRPRKPAIGCRGNADVPERHIWVLMNKLRQHRPSEGQARVGSCGLLYAGCSRISVLFIFNNAAQTAAAPSAATSSNIESAKAARVC